MPLIALKGNKRRNITLFVIVDQIDYDRLNKFKWHVYKHCHTFYARRLKNGKAVFMHREILRLRSPKSLTDHKDHNGLNNSRSNLRVVNSVQSNINRRSIQSGTSKYKGVCWNKNRQKWRAYICVNKKRKDIGCFETQEIAAKAYNNEASKLHGKFANLNTII